ncbi:hypothetical protein [Campylobacter troglodytis]|uniref:hypothetical protein n=1 Tax=Campylobacter troglodytis TaxID=654363 RepID=UPI00115B13D2|nr:hypothetical protein [Campylobacter troglodytis]TQR51037.1 hypothetical protein DMC01_12730 [Campylobacter troglodytis]
MKKMCVIFLVAFISVVFVAHGVSDDLNKSSIFKALSQDFGADSNIDSIKTEQNFNALSQNATNCDESYKQEICGDDYLCNASKCLYKNFTSIDEAFKFYVEQEIQNQVAFLKDRGELESQNTSLVVYKHMLGIALPKINESKNITSSIKDYYSGIQNQCYFEFKRTSESLMIEFKLC